MKGKKFLTLSLTVAFLAGSVMNVSAAGVEDVFDANYYSSQYSDLKAAYGTDEAKLLEHFKNSGAKEGRVMSPILDVVAYRNAYPDLNAAFGDNWDAYVDHYLTNGIREKRMSGVKFDLIDYAAKNPDVKAAFGEDYAAIAEHYLECGIKEGRKGGEIVKETPAAASTGSSGSNTTTQPEASKPTAPQTTAHYHNWEDANGFTALQDSLEPNCTKTGYKLYRCTQLVTVTDANGNKTQVRCSATKKDELPVQHVKPLNVNDINTICATCTQKGEEHYTCRLCGLHVDKEIDLLPHTWVATGKKQVSTCTVKGWDEYKCSVCGTTKQEARPLVPHDIGRWNTVREADCKTEGLKKAACATCYQVFEDIIPRTDHAATKTERVYTDAYADYQAAYHTVQDVTYCTKCNIITQVENFTYEACDDNGLGMCSKCHHDVNRKYSSATKIYHEGEYFRTDVQ